MRSTERGRQVRERLLSAAVQLIAERGWSAVSTRVLAERAGVRSGLVHYHFESLPALLRQATAEAMRAEVARAVSELRRESDPKAGLDRLIDELDGFSGTDPNSVLFMEGCLAATRDRSLRATVGTIIGELTQALTEWLAECRVRQPEATARAVACALDGFALHKALDSTVTADAVRPVLRRMIVTS